MKGCSPECERHPACDFCRHLTDRQADERGVYRGGGHDGWCALHGRPVNLGEWCEDFWCVNASGEEDACA